MVRSGGGFVGLRMYPLIRARLIHLSSQSRDGSPHVYVCTHSGFIILTAFAAERGRYCCSWCTPYFAGFPSKAVEENRAALSYVRLDASFPRGV